MTPLPHAADLDLNDCWNQIGVHGDQSCPQLVEFVHCRNCPVFAEAGQRLFQTAPPAEMIEAWTRQIAEPPAPPEGDSTSLLLFRLNREWLAFEVSAVVEVAELRAVRRVPQRSGRLLQGMVNLRGELQLCVALHALLGIPADDAGPATLARLIVVELNSCRWVFPVSEVAGVVRVLQSAISPPPATIRRDNLRYSRGVLRWEQRSVGVLDAARVLESLAKGLS
jgi:chemotaxis-related protein WspD